MSENPSQAEESDPPECLGIQSGYMLNITRQLPLKQLESLECVFFDGC